MYCCYRIVTLIFSALIYLSTSQANIIGQNVERQAATSRNGFPTIQPAFLLDPCSSGMELAVSINISIEKKKDHDILKYSIISLFPDIISDLRYRSKPYFDSHLPAMLYQISLSTHTLHLHI